MRPHLPHLTREGLLIGTLGVVTVVHFAAVVLTAFSG